MFLFIWNTFLIYFEMLKKLKTKICAYIFTCFVRTKSFHKKKSTYLLSCEKKTKFDTKSKAFYKTYFVLLHQSQKFHEILRTHIDCGDVYMNFFLEKL
jgi:hypothetical protein